MCKEVAYRFGIARIPEPNAPALGSADDDAAIGRPCAGAQKRIRSEQCAKLLAGGNIPRAQRMVPAPRQRLLAVRGESNTEHIMRMSGQSLEFFSAGHIPHLESS